MEALVVVGLLAIPVVLWTALISAIVSAGRLPLEAWNEAGRTKGGTILLMILSGGVGGLYYWIAIRHEVAAAEVDLRIRRERRQISKAANEAKAAEDAKRASWYPDPTESHRYRWWDGTRFTDRVRDGGTEGVDPLADDWMQGEPEPQV